MEILSAAFKAHTAKEYELSIPVLLIQAEGICQDILSVKLFQEERGPSYQVCIRTFLNNPLTQALLSLDGWCGITANEKERLRNILTL